MKKADMKNGKISKYYFPMFALLGIIIGIIAASWSIQIIIQFGNVENPNIIIREYTQFALTLFGFTLIGGIFEGKTHRKQHWIVFSLFTISLIFLLSAVSFLLSYALFSGLNVSPWCKTTFPITFSVGALSFTFAIILLLGALILHYVKDYLMDYDKS